MATKKAKSYADNVHEAVVKAKELAKGSLTSTEAKKRDAKINYRLGKPDIRSWMLTLSEFRLPCNLTLKTKKIGSSYQVNRTIVSLPLPHGQPS